MTYTKPANALGFKYGNGNEAGYSSFGKHPSAEKREGFVFQWVL